MRNPFESSGVETNWEFSMPRGANRMDFRAVYDVLITIEYTALNSFDYRDIAIRGLREPLARTSHLRLEIGPRISGMICIIPINSPNPLSVRFSTACDDFPPNLDPL